MNKKHQHGRYGRYTRKRLMIIAGGFLLLILAGLHACLTGAAPITAADIFQGTLTDGEERILLFSRLPRVLTAVTAGAGLAISGVAMQSILRNPLGSPFTLGISHAAAFGAACAVLVIGAAAQKASLPPGIITMAAFAGSLIATAVIMAVSKIKRAAPEVIVLTGVAISSLFTAGTSFLQYFADDTELAAIVFWTFGDVGRASWSELRLLMIITAGGLVFFWFNRWNFNAMESGDETARSLGVSVQRVRLSAMVAASLVTATAISFLGVIGFVGLVCPHIARRIVSEDFRYLIPFSAICGALLLVLSDTAARTMLSPHVLPVAILTSFLGAPVFIYLLIRRKSGTQC
ncbi:MAG: FecCD family ABC transporter permease [Fibrobacterota bacterium]